MKTPATPSTWLQALSGLLAWMLLWMLLGLSGTILAQPDEPSAPEIYISQWSGEAVYQMAVHGIPASITLAQGILESGSGKSDLAAKSNNHFGIKCHNNWSGGTVHHDDDRKGECFRSYEDPADSFEDHSEFLKKDRYAPLFELEPTDYKNWAKGLKKCGYATNPKYANLLIDLIERYDLSQYDEKGIALSNERDAFAEHKNQHEQIKQDARNEASRASSSPAKSYEVRGHRAVQLSENGILFTLAESGDTYESLATELNMMRWQFYRYNEVQKTENPRTLTAGEVVYLQPKKTRGRTTWMKLKSGESLWEASQRSGVQMDQLIRKNRLTESQPLPPDGRLSLKWRLTKNGKLPNWVRTLRGPEG